MEARKADGGEYERDSFTSFRNSIQRFLSQHNYKYSLIEVLNLPNTGRC